MSIINFNPPIIAHRGASLYAPENTLAAFNKAKALGAKWVEFDVMLAACGEAVVIHDDTLDRTTNGKGMVSEYPYSYLRTLDAGSWFSAEFAGEHIPTFREVINCLRENGLSANVEIKPLEGLEEKTVHKVLSDIAVYWGADMAPPLISSFSMPSLRFVRKYSPDALIGVLVDEWFPGWEEICEELKSVSVNVNYEILDPLIVKSIKSRHQLILSYTLNDPERALEIVSWGVDAIFTNDFIEMLKVLPVE